MLMSIIAVPPFSPEFFISIVLITWSAFLFLATPVARLNPNNATWVPWVSDVLLVVAFLSQGEIYMTLFLVYGIYQSRKLAPSITPPFSIGAVALLLYGGFGVLDSLGVLGRYGSKIFLSFAFAIVISMVVFAIVGLNRLKNEPQYRSPLS
jgi:hypothetical protein